MNKPPKIDRKSLKNPDEFMKKGQAVLADLQGRRHLLLPGLVVLMVILFGFYGASWWSERKLEQAWRAYAEAEKLPADQKWERFKAMEANHGSNRATLFAVVALGDHFFDEAKKEALKAGGNPASAATEAANWYSRALNYSILVPTEKQLLLVDRGSVHEITQKLDEAIADYQRAVDIDGHAKGFALLSLARAYELKNDPAKATETYNKVATDFADSEFGKQAKTAIRRLKGAIYKEQAKG